MKFTIFTHVDHLVLSDKIYGYAPYVREMNVWLSKFNKIVVVGPKSNREKTNIDLAYESDKVEFIEIPTFSITNSKALVQTILLIPKLIGTIYIQMRQSDHIHLRCPGNVGLLACFVQIFFPKKIKTAKYAGNWDPKAKQPWSYKVQKWMLNNTFLTKNMRVLVYGEWQGTSKNIVPFFTATYSDTDAEYSLSLPQKRLPSKSLPIQFIYVGTLSKGKRPLYAVQLFQQIQRLIPNATLTMYGAGSEQAAIQNFIQSNDLSTKVHLLGNQPKEVVEKAYQESHFLFLASQSEGWPKVVAEAMFWGCVPLATNVSCVHQMMGFGSRGVLLDVDLIKDTQKIVHLIQQPNEYVLMSEQAKKWSTHYTMNKFESEISKLLI